jgi:hypothetical protein
LAEGDVVGADARVLEAHELQVDEALLTSGLKGAVEVDRRLARRFSRHGPRASNES